MSSSIINLPNNFPNCVRFTQVSLYYLGKLFTEEPYVPAAACAAGQRERPPISPNSTYPPLRYYITNNRSFPSAPPIAPPIRVPFNGSKRRWPTRARRNWPRADACFFQLPWFHLKRLKSGRISTRTQERIQRERFANTTSRISAIGRITTNVNTHLNGC
jgi:hypothetical protein